MKKKINLILIILIILIIIITGLIIYYIINQNSILGGDRDSHGCIGSAGYSWNDSVGACIREWEFDENQRKAVRIATLPLSYRVTAIDVQPLRCPGCFIIKLQRNDNGIISTVELDDWKYKFNLDCNNYSLDKCPVSCVVCPPCEACSSLRCQTKEFCESIGFNETWYNDMNPKKTYCTKEQKSAEFCPEYYSATCGWFKESINCIKYPCAQTFSNPCFACMDENVEYYTQGECPE